MLGKIVEIPINIVSNAISINKLSAIMLSVGSVIINIRMGSSLVKVGLGKPLVIIVFTVILAILQKLIEQVMRIKIPLIGEKAVALKTVMDNTSKQVYL